MLRTILFSLLFSLPMAFTNKAMAQDDEKIYWHRDSLLKWTDFKGPVDKASPFHAFTYSEIRYSYTWRSNNNKYVPIFKTESFLVPARSWSIKSKQTAALLRHEQVHFDIAEYFARLLLQTLNQQTYTQNHKAEIEAISQDMIKKMQAMHDLYDAQTDHSKDKAAQAQWEQQLASVLKSDGLTADASPVSGAVK